MNYLTTIYQQITKSIMATKNQKKELPKDAKGWAKFAKANKITKPFFQLDGLTRRTSDGKDYHYIEDFNADGGTIEKVQIIKKAK